MTSDNPEETKRIHKDLLDIIQQREEARISHEEYQEDQKEKQKNKKRSSIILGNLEQQKKERAKEEASKNGIIYVDITSQTRKDMFNVRKYYGERRIDLDKILANPEYSWLMKNFQDVKSVLREAGIKGWDKRNVFLVHSSCFAIQGSQHHLPPRDHRRF